MAKTIKIKKGLDIPLDGRASDEVMIDLKTDLYAITPDDFPGYTWKVVVKPGDEVAIGCPLLKAKEDETIILVSPVAGVVDEVCRGERRHIEYVSVKRQNTEVKNPVFSLDGKNDEILLNLKRSGLFALMRQRPFDIVPDSNVVPRDIFITAFDTAPLSAPMLAIDEVEKFLEAGIKVLSRLTTGKVYLSVPTDCNITSATAEIVKFDGKHPTGNVGIQIAAIRPVNKGETVWTLNAVTAALIGMLAVDGVLSFATTVAITGPEAKNPRLVKTFAGAAIASLIDGEVKDDGKNVRIISGNVLTGIQVYSKGGFLHYPYRQITLIKEGDDADEFMGWASMNPKKYSVKRTFPAFLRGNNKPYDFDARIKGGHRAMILSGEYDKVFPFDIYPEYLIKAILSRDFERMEQLGIYEVAPEDFALPEFVDTSKLELQQIVRDGLDWMRSEM